MERDYSLASVLGASAGVAAAVLLATLVIAAPHLGSGALADWGSNRHSHRGHEGSGDDPSTRSHGNDCGASCASPVHGAYDGGGTFAPPETSDRSLGNVVPFGGSDDGDQGHTINGANGPGPIPGVGGGGFDSHKGSTAPTFFTGSGGSPSGFLGKTPPTETTPSNGTTPSTPTPPTTAVPEPADWALMLIGLGVVGGALRARRGSVHAL